MAEALRRRIRTEAPGLRESVKWGSPVWNGHGDVLCLMVYPHWVHLGLFQGAALAERFEGIEGTGKRLRHVRVPTAEAAGSPEIGAILRAAVALDASGELPGPPPARRAARRGTAPRRP